ncbi:MAG: hypothetical protein J4F36_05470 [Nitrosopumilaceae archaeon]|nr:hypothetical protein [Nitrosopumilaceae archaeon]
MTEKFSFSLFSFSYPANLRKILLDSPKETMDEKVKVLHSQCKEQLLIKGMKSIDELKQIVLDNYDNGNYLVLYTSYDDILFKDKITEILLKKQNKEILFRIFSKHNIESFEILYYLIYKGLDVNTISSSANI